MCKLHEQIRYLSLLDLRIFPDLAPAGHYLFPNVQTFLMRHRFASAEDLKMYAMCALKEVTKTICRSVLKSGMDVGRNICLSNVFNPHGATGWSVPLAVIS